MKYSIIRTGHAHGASEYAGYTNNWNSASEKDERGGAEVFRKSTKTLTPPFEGVDVSAFVFHSHA